MDDLERDDTAVGPEIPRRGEGRRRALGRLGLALLWISGGVILLAIVGVLGLAALIAHGPVEIEAAARTAEAILRDVAGPKGTARVGNARIDWSADKGLAVALTDIAVERPGVATVAVPAAEFRLQIAPLLRGEVKPRELIVDAPKVELDFAGLAAAGALAGAAEATPAAPAATPEGATTAPGPSAVVVAAVVPRSTTELAARRIAAVVDGIVARARDEGIHRFAVRHGSVEVKHRTAAGGTATIVVPDIDAAAVVDGPAGEFDADFSARGEVGRWSLRLTASRETDGRRHIAFAGEDLTRRDLFGPAGPAFDVGMPIYPKATLDFAADGGFAGAAVDLRLGAGEFRFGPMPEDSMLVDEGAAQLVWAPASDAIEIRNLYLAVGETGMTLHGRLTPTADPAQPWAIRLDADGGSFRPRDVPGKPLVVEGGHVDARWIPATRRLEIAGAEGTFAGGWARAVGALDFSGPEPKMRLDLTFSPLDVEQVKRVWPHWVAVDTRDWFIHAVEAGRAVDAWISLDMPRFDKPETWPPGAFRMGVRFEGARFRPFGNLPLVQGDGRMTIGDRHMELVLDKAQVLTRAARKPTLDGMRFYVADFVVKPPKASVHFQVAGDVTALAEIVNSEPLAVLDESGIKADGLSGTGTVTAQVDVVFDKPMRSNSVDYKIEATLDRFSSQSPIQGRKFQDGKFRVVVDPRGVRVTGRAQIDGVVADVDMYDTHGGSKAGDKRDFKMTLDDAARQRIGLDLGGLVHGAIGVDVKQPSPTDPKRRFEVDLTPARLVLSQFGWSKGAGVPAKATFDLLDDDKGLRLDNLAIESEGLAIGGSVVLDKERRLVSADLGRFALRKGDNAKLKLTRGSDQVITVAFDAQNFDLRGLMQANRKPGGEDGGGAQSAKSPEMILKLRAAKLIGFNDVTVSDVAVDGRYKGGAFASLSATGRSSGGRSFSATIKAEGERRMFTVNSDDAGAMMSFSDAFDRVSGGRMTLAARLGAPGVAQGTLRLSDFRLLEEPKSGRAEVQKLAGGGEQVKVRRAEINPQTDFSRASIAFSMRDGVVTVSEAVAKGTSVGATSTGQIDLNNQRIALTGTYIPAYGLNNLAGRIPIVGQIAGAGSNEGLLGVTFRVFGPIEDPVLEINPLSAIAPGIFRRIFEFQKDDARTPPDPGNAPTRITP